MTARNAGGEDRDRGRDPQPEPRRAPAERQDLGPRRRATPASAKVPRAPKRSRPHPRSASTAPRPHVGSPWNSSGGPGRCSRTDSRAVARPATTAISRSVPGRIRHRGSAHAAAAKRLFCWHAYQLGD